MADDNALAGIKEPTTEGCVARRGNNKDTLSAADPRQAVRTPNPRDTDPPPTRPDPALVDPGRRFDAARDQAAALRIKSAAFSPIMIDGALVLPPIRVGMIEASTTRRPAMPRTLSSGSTTAPSSTPMRQVPTGW